MDDETSLSSIPESCEELFHNAQSINRNLVEVQKVIYDWVFSDLFSSGLASVTARLKRGVRRNVAHETLESLLGVMEEVRMIQRMVSEDSSMINRGRLQIQAE